MASSGNTIIVACWLLFIGYWAVSARRLKPAAQRQSRLASLSYRGPQILGAILLMRPAYTPLLLAPLTPQMALTRVLGETICVLGLAVAIWARYTLAGNWSGHITFKEDHELIQTGPYRFARHPIYTGILLMALGTASVGGELSRWAGVLFLFVGFWIKLRQEESLMRAHFPDTYPGYQKRVKALVPFIL